MSVETFKHLQPDFLFEHEKGGSGGMNAMIMMMQQQQAQAAADAKAAAKKADDDRKAADRQRKRDEAAALDSSNQRIETTFQSAINNARNKLIKQGYKGEALDSMMNDFTAKLTTSRNALDPKKPIEDPTIYFNDTGLDAIVSGAESEYDAGLDKTFNEYAGTGFANKRITDEADDAFINAILDEQQGEGRRRLDSQLARGAINDIGYSTGLTELSRQRSAANAAAQDAGMAVLNKGRGGLETTAGTWKKKAEDSQYGDSFDYSGMNTEFDTQTSKFLSGLEADITNAISGTDYFDFDKLIGKAGTGGGVMNTPVTPNTGVTNTPLLAPTENRILSTEDEEARRRAGVF